MVFQLSKRLAFPDPHLGEPDGLLAIGGDLSIDRLLLAYSRFIHRQTAIGILIRNIPVVCLQETSHRMVVPDAEIRYLPFRDTRVALHAYTDKQRQIQNKH